VVSLLPPLIERCVAHLASDIHCLLSGQGIVRQSFFHGVAPALKTFE